MERYPGISDKMSVIIFLYIFGAFELKLEGIDGTFGRLGRITHDVLVRQQFPSG